MGFASFLRVLLQVRSLASYYPAQVLRRQRSHLLQQLNTPLPGDSDSLNTEALSQVSGGTQVWLCLG